MDRQTTGKKEKNGLAVMFGLLGLIRPLLWELGIAILMGCAGNLAAAFLTISGSVGIGAVLGFFPEISLGAVFSAAAACALLRGILRYAEQACNHDIAFRLLAGIRQQVFEALRKLAPAKLEGRQKGNLISVITGDIELLEVFYAHTISPVFIAVLTSLVMTGFLGSLHWVFALIAAFFYVLVGGVIPVYNSRRGQKTGQDYRRWYGELNTVLLDNLYGVEEILQYQWQKERKENMDRLTERLETAHGRLKKQEAIQKIAADSAILGAGILMAAAGGILVMQGAVSGASAAVAAVAMMSSFGPTAALSALSNNLNQTLASGKRVLELLEEEPAAAEIMEGACMTEGEIRVEGVSFSYPEKREEERVLRQFSIRFLPNQIHGILGKSGCGKSTLLKLLMRFYEAGEGQIFYGKEEINGIQTADLRRHISYVTQETFLFQDTIANNIRIAKADATDEEVKDAARKAAIHDFIVSLPKGYETRLSEPGTSVSGGERQRIGLARAFLHEADVIFLDEPTSNIDSLNEGMILKSLLEEKANKTIVLVSHRASTMSVADQVTVMQA